MSDTELREQIEELMDVGNLTRWETSFLIDMAARIDGGRPLSEGQMEKLQQIIEAKLK